MSRGIKTHIMKNTKIFTYIITFLSGIFYFLIGRIDIQFWIFIGVIVIDYVTGLIVAGVFHNSPKTKNGRIESNISIKGLIRKFLIFVVIIIANWVDILLKVNFIRDSVMVAFIINEILSILENVGLMGVPIPKAITNALEVLKGDNDDNNDKPSH